MHKDVIIEKMLAGAVKHHGIPPEEARTIAVHMVSWLDELYKLVRFYNDPEDYDEKYITEMLEEFLTHVPRHLDIAKHLYYKDRILVKK